MTWHVRYSAHEAARRTPRALPPLASALLNPEEPENEQRVEEMIQVI